MQFWFRRKYQLTPNDPKFLDLTIEDIETDYWAHYYYENSTADEVEDEDFDLDDILQKMENDDWEEL
ncbi:hypothetical protein [Nitrosomonas sp. Nm132]|uniref:hypothetical protein n=1 Tax=Nitrosomonas sp. Nm132 TaxID=1881053 RepID=UPI00087E7BA7|nr:hypothetical protein [Nitrosomonas sp. Nm132]SDH27408.1 hypothetical protein SAMN05428952_100982 [Nitrosomonas sp. Nm132]